MARLTNIEQTIEAIERELNDSTVDMGFGAVKRSQHRRHRSIVWVRPAGEIEAVPIGGGLLRTAEESAAEGTSTGSQAGDRVDYCYSVVDAAVAIITAEDGAAAEHLMYALLAAIKKACGNHARPANFTWPVESAGGSHTHRPSIELRVGFTYLAPEAVAGLTVILGTQHTHVLNGNPDPLDHT